MQLYHHAFSMDSQKVRLALEEKGMDYISHSLNPLKGDDLDPEFLRINPAGKMPVFKNGNCVIFETLSILQFVNGVNEPLGAEEVDKDKMQEWMQRIEEWDPKLFTLSHVPARLRRYFSRFKRRVAMARMETNPDLASNYHGKLRDAYALEDLLKDRGAVEENRKKLEEMLDMAEEELQEKDFLAGGTFSMADAMLLPVLGWTEMVGEGWRLTEIRPRLRRYWRKAKRRKAYRVVIGRRLGGINLYFTLLSAAVNVSVRHVLRRY